MLELSAFLQTTTGHILTFTAIILIAHMIAKLAVFLLEQQYQHPHFFKQNKTQHAIIKHSMAAFLHLIGIGFAIYTIPPLRSLAVSLFAGAGVLAIIVGFASQHALANIISGIFIAVFTPFRVGDQIRINANDVYGVVEDINLRHTTIRTYDNKRIVMPNSVINSETIINYNLEDEKICEYVEVTVSYDSDLELALELISDVSEQHPSCIDVRTPSQIEQGVAKVNTRVIAFEDSGIKIRACAWAKAPRLAFLMHCDLRKAIKEAFEAHDIEIPYPHRTMIMQKDKRMTKKRKPKSKTKSRDK